MPSTEVNTHAYNITCEQWERQTTLNDRGREQKTARQAWGCIIMISNVGLFFACVCKHLGLTQDWVHTSKCPILILLLCKESNFFTLHQFLVNTKEKLVVNVQLIVKHTLMLHIHAPMWVLATQKKTHQMLHFYERPENKNWNYIATAHPTTLNTVWIRVTSIDRPILLTHSV